MGFDITYDRTTGWGASEVGKIARGCRFTYLLKRQHREKPDVPWVKEFEGNERTENGNQLEEWIIRRGAELAQVEIIDLDPESLAHPERDYIFATTDGIGIDPVTKDKCIIEAKLVGFGPHMDWGSSDEGWDALPFNVAAQVTTQMAVHDLDIGWVFAFIGSEMKTIRVERDRDFELELFDICYQMWIKVLAQEDPPPGPEADVKSYYAKKWTKPSEQMITAEEATDLIIQRERFRLDEKNAAEQKATVENMLRILIAENDGVKCSIGKATNKFGKSGRRTLRVTVKKED